MKEEINCDIHATIIINKIWIKHQGIPILNIPQDAETPWNSINSQMHCTQNRIEHLYTPKEYISRTPDTGKWYLLQFNKPSTAPNSEI